MMHIMKNPINHHHHHHQIYFFLCIWLFACEIEVIEQRWRNSETIGERICAALMPVVAVVEVLIFAVSNCFSYCPRIVHNHKCGAYTAKDLARLADETRCKSIHFIFFSVPIISISISISISLLINQKASSYSPIYMYVCAVSFYFLLSSNWY